jgi:hypothetical protein
MRLKDYDQDERDMNGKNRTDKESLDEIEGEWNDLNKKVNNYKY